MTKRTPKSTGVEIVEREPVSMPIVDAVYDILYNGLNPEEGVRMLMTR